LEGQDLGGGPYEAVLRRMLESIPPADRDRALARILDELARLHREEGAEVPAWLDEMRRRLDAP
jgi:hypothetical protein